MNGLGMMDCSCCGGLQFCGRGSLLRQGILEPRCPKQCRFLTLGIMWTNALGPGDDPLGPCQDLWPAGCVSYFDSSLVQRWECRQVRGSPFLLKRIDDRTYRRVENHFGISVEVTLSQIYNDAPWPGSTGQGAAQLPTQEFERYCLRIVERIVVEGPGRRFEVLWDDKHRMYTSGTCGACNGWAYVLGMQWLPWVKVLDDCGTWQDLAATLSVSGFAGPADPPDPDTCCTNLNRVYNLSPTAFESLDCCLTGLSMQGVHHFADPCFGFAEFDATARANWGASSTIGDCRDVGFNTSIGGATLGYGNNESRWAMYCQNRHDPFAPIAGTPLSLTFGGGPCDGDKRAAIGGI